MSDCIPEGFRAAGIRAGIKPSGGLDLAIVISDRPCVAAGVFTQNRFAAAPVQWCRSLLPTDTARAIVINAGNANAATGEQGLANARRIAEIAGRELGCDATQVLLASTGVIGRQLPMDVIEPNVPQVVRAAIPTPDGFALATQSILTTDTRPKVSERVVTLATGEARVFGFCKGAAMIGPNMATMLAFILTDAPIGPGKLQGLLTSAVDDSFNCISVEGHTSTNDTVIALASSEAKRPLVGDDLAAFSRELALVCKDLARQIVDDGEGTTHSIRIDVAGCESRDEAKAIAQMIANDALVKTAIHGADPNWGRIVSAAGRAGVDFATGELSLWLNGFALYQAGAPVAFDAGDVSRSIKSQREVTIRIEFQRGSHGVQFLTTDLTAEYVRLNADYTT